MKKLLILTLSFVTLSTFAQKGNYDVSMRNRESKGYLVYENNDTVRGSFHIYNMPVMQASCQITPTNTESYHGGSWDKIIFYEYEDGIKWYSSKLTTLKAPADPKRFMGGAETFLNVIEFGPISLFDYNFLDETVSPTKDEVKSYMQLPNGDVVDVSSLLLGFKKKMAEYVKDYPELSKKIADKEKGYGMLYLNNIVREYNEWYMAENPGFSLMK